MKIGVFDSGYGGLTVLEAIRRRLPQYDYIYLGDNARNPYGPRSFEVVYEFTLQSVKKLFSLGAELVILGCNTASAKALRNIQQKDLPVIAPEKRVLGIIRPSAEVIGNYTKSRHVGIFGTQGTVDSDSYRIEIEHQWPDIIVAQQACPMWVPLVEYGEYDKPGADYFVQKYVKELMAKLPDIDAIILACTHYPMLIPKIKKYLPEGVTLLGQGDIVAEKLADYLTRHPEMECRISKGGTLNLYTTESTDKFRKMSKMFFEGDPDVKRINIEN